MEYKTVQYNGLTKETVERVSTSDEIKEIEKLQAKMEVRKEAKQAQAIAKAALLTQLGITEEQAKLLLS
jgi:tellurite resistance protein